MFEKQQGFMSLMGKIQICRPMMAVWGVTLPAVCCEACRCNNPAMCLHDSGAQMLALHAVELKVYLPLSLALYK